MKKLLVLILAAAMLAFAGSAQALVEYTANFTTGAEGWDADGPAWSATDGQDGGGYFYGVRNYWYPYLVPAATAPINGNATSNFQNQIITFSYYLKDISDTMKTPPQIYMFVDSDGGGWDMFWAYTPGGANMPEEWGNVPKDWTKYAFSVDTTAAMAPEGWTFGMNSDTSPVSTWAESWQHIALWNFCSGAGGAGDSICGIDTVLVTNDPAARIIFVPGDANKDGDVDADDAATLAGNWLQSGKLWADGDFNQDGLVDDKDATLMATNWGYGVPQGSSSVPEPGVFVLLLAELASLAAIRLTRGGK